MRVNPITPVVKTQPTKQQHQPKKENQMSEHNPTYPSVTLSKNLTPVPRTLSEANRDAKYACAIQTFKSDAKLTLDFIEQAVIGALWVAVVVGGLVGVVYMFSR